MNRNERKYALSRPYPAIQDQRKMIRSFGGNQGWFDRLRIRENGCGLIGAADLLLYMTGTLTALSVYLPVSDEGDGQKRDRNVIPKETYITYVEELNRRCFPILPYFGMPGYVLSFGLNCCFRKYGLPYRASWGVRSSRIASSVKEMLDQDIPVILAIGPNVPYFWRRENLTLYRKNQKGQMTAVQSTRGHYVTVTAVMGDYLEISSWGEPFYIRWSEYQKYLKGCSNPLFCNLCYIVKRDESGS